MRKIISALFYFFRHPSSPLVEHPDYSFFPSDTRLNPIIQPLLNTQETPVFILDPQVVVSRYNTAIQALRRYWKHPVIAYSFKTNYEPIDVVRRLGAHAEVTSGHELKLALSKSYTGNHIVFNGPHKDDKSLRTAIKNGVLIQVDNTRELFAIDVLSKRIRMPVRIGCRVNLSDGRLPPSRFGMSGKELFGSDVLKILKTHAFIRMEGVHFHIGTDIGSLSMYKQAAVASGAILQKLAAKGIAITYINCGGGVRSHGLKPFGARVWEPYDFSEYVHALYTGLYGQYPNARALRVYIEPGRFLIDDAVTFVSRVLRVKWDGLKQTVYIDGSTAMLPLSQYRPQIIRSYTRIPAKHVNPDVPTIMYGATCREDDVPYRGWLSHVAPGDLLLFYCVGAYNQSLGSDFIFQKPVTRVLPM